MKTKPNILIRFWQELKRRKVFNVLAMYAGSAFIIIQVEGSLADPLNLPRWVGTLIVIILSAGFPVTAILAWIFDLTPQGLKKTESFEESESKEIVKPPERRRLKASDVVMVVMAITIIILIWPKVFNRDAVDRLKSSGEKLSVAVMPFKNMTNDTTWNVYQDGIQVSLISSFANTGEIKVRHKESIQELFQAQGLTEYASISPAIAGTISKKLEADIFVYGSIQKAGPKVRLDAQLIDTRTNEVLKSIEVNGPYKDAIILDITDSLRKKVTDFLLISKLIKENPDFGRFPVSTSSPEALRYLIYGMNARNKGDFASGVTWALKALAADSNYAEAAFLVESSYSSAGNMEQSKQWLIRNYENRNRMDYYAQLYASWAYAFSFESPDEQIKYLKQLQEFDDKEPSNYYLLGVTYYLLKQYDKVIPEFVKYTEILRKWGKEYLKYNSNYYYPGIAYHKTGQYKKEKELYKLAERYIPDDPFVIIRQAVLAFTEKDTSKANRYIEKLISGRKARGGSEAFLAYFLGMIYDQADSLDKAEEYYRKALSLEPDNMNFVNDYTNFLLDNDRNLNEVSELMDKAMKATKDKMNYYYYMDIKGWSLYKMGKYKEALEIIQKAWDQAPFKIYSIRSHLEEVKKAAKEQGVL